MRLTRLELRIVASFVVALIVIATGWVGARALTSALATRAQAKRSRLVVEAADALRLNILETETAQRGYLLTMDKAYLDRYRADLQQADLIATLRRAYGEDPDAAPTFERLSANVARARAEMANTIAIARARGVDSALETVSGASGERFIEAIQIDLDDLVKRERLQRDALSQRTEAKVKLARAVVLSGTLLAFALAVVVNLSLMSALREREEAQRVVETQSDQLRQQTESLLVHEAQLAAQLDKQKELSRALQRSNDELDQFAYATSHDLKAPLRGITNLASFVEDDLGPSIQDGVKQNLELLRGRARRLEALIEGILAYSRAGRVRSKIERVDTGALAREVVELIAPPAGCAIAIRGELPVLETERAPLQQVMMNLIQNSVKHGCPTETGTIEIGCVDSDGIPKFYVQDHGPGIAPEYHQRVFGVFQTLAARDKVEGAGIGLAVVKKLVESRGGQVELTSRVGEGARFDFGWPSVPGSA